MINIDNLNPFELTESANIIAIILIMQEYSNNELNVISQWFMQVGQYLTTYVSQKILIENSKESNNTDT